MGNWGEDFDEELKNQEEIEVGVRFGFKGMSFLIDRIVEETREYDDKHPKDDLRFILFNDLFIIAILVTFSYNILMIVTLFFMLFYGYILIQLGKAWKRFSYSMWQYRLMAILGLIVAVAVGVVAQILIF
ncbi:MAG: hypothetical protein IKJ39_05325 [Lachnospiraceae bacterium]|nr:hypothetical protein [Lachnospiraceae bacterium]